ncbi:MAG: hypothetical protein HPY82_15055 [Gammaproteobacteria bacterium]|nr:hypothetical protein [Gammaproteobacteria bacterium]
MTQNLETRTQLTAGNIPCPFCRAPIILDLQSILAARPLRCTQCDAELQLNRDASIAALDQLQHWHSAMEQAQQPVVSTPDEPVMIPRQRKPRRPRT